MDISTQNILINIGMNDLLSNWCSGVVVKHAESQHRGCQFDFSMCHF